MQSHAPDSRDTRDCVRAIINLYTLWNAAEPGKGYDAKETQWRQTLAELQAALPY